ESEGIPDNMCNVPFHDNSPPLDVSKYQFEDFSDSNNESTSTDDDSFSIDNIEYVEASPPDSEFVSSEVLSQAWETILEIKLAFEDKHCQPEDILELFQKLHNDVQNIYEELAMYINTSSWDRPTICYDDDDEDYAITVTSSLSTEEVDSSLSMRDEHLETIPATKSDEFIKSSVESLIPIPSESEEE
nr:hypothetical protein [Tanacetum cinerariifolium]